MTGVIGSWLGIVLFLAFVGAVLWVCIDSARKDHLDDHGRPVKKKFSPYRDRP